MKKYTSIIGFSPSKGARSPKLWNYAFKKYRIKNEMVPFDVKNNNLSKLLNFLELDQNYIGGCVTVPYKEKVFRWLGKNITKTSKKIGAVNCLFRGKNGKLIGTNTDGEAALKSFENKFGKVKNKRILLLGPGGAGKAVASYFSQAIKNKKSLIIAGRSLNSKKFSKKLKAKWFSFKNISKIELYNIDIVINCTSLGFSSKIKKSPLSKLQLLKLRKSAKVFDIIYEPKETELIKMSKQKKIKTINGLEMNLIQAALAFHYVTKKSTNLTLKHMCLA
jgi:shikimate dehydrogenase